MPSYRSGWNEITCEDRQTVTLLDRPEFLLANHRQNETFAFAACAPRQKILGQHALAIVRRLLNVCNLCVVQAVNLAILWHEASPQFRMRFGRGFRSQPPPRLALPGSSEETMSIVE